MKPGRRGWVASNARLRFINCANRPAFARLGG